MAFYRVQCSIPNDSALPRDLAVNTWHFETNDLGTAANERLDIVNAISEFYTAIDQFLSENVGSPLRVRIYDLKDAPPRLPVYDNSQIVLAPSATTPFPNEVAACLSYKGDDASGVRRARNRGRIFIGPLSSAVGIDDVGDFVMSNTHRDQLANAALAAFLPVAAPLSLSTIFWSVFSRADALGLAVGAPGPANEPTYTAAQLVNGFRPVRSAWVDNAFDTQRRRGRAATLRTTVNHP